MSLSYCFHLCFCTELFIDWMDEPMKNYFCNVFSKRNWNSSFWCPLPATDTPCQGECSLALCRCCGLNVLSLLCYFSHCFWVGHNLQLCQEKRAFPMSHLCSLKCRNRVFPYLCEHKRCATWTILGLTLDSDIILLLLALPLDNSICASEQNHFTFSKQALLLTVPHTKLWKVML